MKVMKVMPMKTIAHQQLTDYLPVLRQYPPGQHFPLFIAERDAIWYGICLWSVGSAVPAVSASILCAPVAYLPAG